ncbi:AP-3 complex subunit mu-2 isoform X4 [Macaca fascicularis]|uniref:AP-3 complex subunit mu-2 isoform X4 n=1 Tax=Macaca fascicularis TaxID=9541 RepID=UPI0032B08094
MTGASTGPIGVLEPDNRASRQQRSIRGEKRLPDAQSAAFRRRSWAERSRGSRVGQSAGERLPQRARWAGQGLSAPRSGGLCEQLGRDYFGVCSEPVIKDNVVVVYEVLEEMLDNGFPLATESNILKELIKPPTILRTVVNTITGSTNVGDQLPTGQLSVVPWRRTGVKYTNNEAYFDVIEEIDAIIDKSGSTITAEIQGVIDACVKLTGMPDLTLSFMNPRLLDDVSFHPCVRFKRWESERILSFIPPDGNFRLLSYHVSAQNLVAIPVYVKHNISFRDSSSLGRFEITVGPKQTMGKTIEGVTVTSQMPKGVLNMSLTPSQGTHTFDPVTKMLSWDVGKINPQKPPNLKGTMSLQAGASKPDENPTINLQFKIQQLAISGLKVNRLDMYGEKYKPFKGIKYMTKAGKFQVRT